MLLVAAAQLEVVESEWRPLLLYPIPVIWLSRRDLYLLARPDPLSSPRDLPTPLSAASWCAAGLLGSVPVAMWSPWAEMVMLAAVFLFSPVLELVLLGEMSSSHLVLHQESTLSVARFACPPLITLAALVTSLWTVVLLDLLIVEVFVWALVTVFLDRLALCLLSLVLPEARRGQLSMLSLANPLRPMDKEVLFNCRQVPVLAEVTSAWWAAKAHLVMPALSTSLVQLGLAALAVEASTLLPVTLMVLAVAGLFTSLVDPQVPALSVRSLCKVAARVACQEATLLLRVVKVQRVPVVFWNCILQPELLILAVSLFHPALPPLECLALSFSLLALPSQDHLAMSLCRQELGLWEAEVSQQLPVWAKLVVMSPCLPVCPLSMPAALCHFSVAPPPRLREQAVLSNWHLPTPQDQLVRWACLLEPLLLPDLDRFRWRAETAPWLQETWVSLLAPVPVPLLLLFLLLRATRQPATERVVCCLWPAVLVFRVAMFAWLEALPLPSMAASLTLSAVHPAALAVVAPCMWLVDPPPRVVVVSWPFLVATLPLLGEMYRCKPVCLHLVMPVAPLMSQAAWVVSQSQPVMATQHLDLWNCRLAM
jgi:hypothetical protein